MAQSSYGTCERAVYPHFDDSAGGEKTGGWLQHMDGATKWSRSFQVIDMTCLEIQGKYRVYLPILIIDAQGFDLAHANDPIPFGFATIHQVATIRNFHSFPRSASRTLQPTID